MSAPLDRCGKLLLGAWYCLQTDAESEQPCQHATYNGSPVVRKMSDEEYMDSYAVWEEHQEAHRR